MQPRVAVVILNWNGFEDTRDCLQSVLNLAYDNYGVILVDNGSVDGSGERLKSAFPDVELIRNPRNEGFAGGNNQGMKLAFGRGAEYAWLLNNDTIVPSDTLSRLVCAIEGTGAGLASPLIYFHGPEGKLQFCGSVVDWKRREIRHIEDLDGLGRLDPSARLSLWGTALLVRRRVAVDIGYLPEKYFAYHEDEAFCLRAHAAGHRCIVVPEARVYHKNSRSTGSNDAPLQVFLRSRNRYFLWMDVLKGADRAFHVPRYLSQIVSYGGSLQEKNLPRSIDACLDGAWAAFRGAGGPRGSDLAMPRLLRRVFRFLFSWHPYFWSNLLRGNVAGITADLVKRIRPGKAGA